MGGGQVAGGCVAWQCSVTARVRRCWVALLLCWPAAGGALATVPDVAGGAAAAHYVPVSGVAGNLSSVGSDTMAGLMALWAERFQSIYPGVNIQLQAAGSATAPAALTQGTAGIGPMSRAMTAAELHAFERRHGHAPLGVVVAVDAIALYVHEYNPIEGFSLAELDAMFSHNRRCGGGGAIRLWSGLGLAGSWEHRPIALYGRSSASGTYGHFKEQVLCGGDFSSSVNELPASSAVAQAVAGSLGGVGYAGMASGIAGVRAVPLRSADGAPYVAANAANALAGTYPLTRSLHIYVNKPPGAELAPLEREFLRFVLSPDGQRLVAAEGYIPLSAPLLQRQSQVLGL